MAQGGGDSFREWASGDPTVRAFEQHLMAQERDKEREERERWNMLMQQAANAAQIANNMGAAPITPGWVRDAFEALAKAGQLPEPPKPNAIHTSSGSFFGPPWPTEFPETGVGPDLSLDQIQMDRIAEILRNGELTMADTVMTPVGVLSFPKLFEPRTNDRGEKRYELNLIFDAAAQKTPAFKALKAAIDKEGQEFFKGKLPGGAHYPLKDAGEKDFAGYDDGSIFISAWTKSKPGVVGPSREEITIPDDVWAGQLARATVKPFGFNTAGKKGISLMLNNVQIAKLDGERLDGRKAAKDEFSDVEAGEDDSPF